ncbi:MAG: transporter substrate-binding domain-containing protein [Dethiosulfatibacter sp.]|nr:transporter substrate-binding domain-containing protein [Dethiosulfatibacter sp.]
MHQKKNCISQAILLLCLVAMYLLLCNTTVEATSDSKPLLIIGDDVDYPPYSFIDEDGNPAGFNVELAKAVGEAMGYQVEIRLDEWSKTREALESGDIDVIAGMFRSLEREKIYSFTIVHNITNGDIVTTKNIKMNSLDDLRNQTVVVQKGDIVGEYLKELDYDINFIEVATYKEVVNLIESGQYDYAGLLKLPAMYSIRDGRYTNIVLQGFILNQNSYSMAVLKGNEKLLLTLNGGLQLLKATGEYDEIYDKWLGIYEEMTLQAIFFDYLWFFMIVISIFVFFFISTFILKKLVNIKTTQLKEINLDFQVNTESLMISEKKNEAILSALPDLVFVLDNHSVFLDYRYNNGKKLLLSEEEYTGKRIEEIFPLSIANLTQENIDRAFQTEELQVFEYDLEVNGNEESYEVRMVKTSETEVIAIIRNITSAKIYRKKIEYLSYHDGLTGLYNRRFFEEEMNRLDKDRNLPLCIIMADLNGLKLVNDSFGHLVGDELLIKVANVLKKACRADEIIARIGGDEFVILIPDMGEEQVIKLIERIESNLAEERVGDLEISVSIGWSVKYDNTEIIHDIFRKAENMMYKKKLYESPKMRNQTINAIIKSFYEKSKREANHAERVSGLSLELAKALQLQDSEIEAIRILGLFHDVGKITIDDAIINKVGILSAEEFEEIKSHSEMGYRILNSVGDFTGIADDVLYHHERWDGTGYPRGLKGDEIPLQARIIAIAEAYDAMIGERSYKITKSRNEAIEELERNAGIQFDPEMVKIFIEKVLRQ